MAQSRHGRLFFKAMLALLLALGFIPVGLAQDEDAVAFDAFRCTYNAATNTADIYYSLSGSDGYPLAAGLYTVDVLRGNTGEPVAINAQRESLLNRQPVRIIIVLDVTNTMPLQQVVNAISNYLVPGLTIGDEVAIIKAGSTISPVTAFYTDKNRLINEHLFDLETQDGDNRVFDGVRDAVVQMSPTTEQRQIVLLLTDSRRRDTPQAPLNTIIPRAKATGAQVYVIGIRTAGDQPDGEELRQLAAGTEGYAWINEEGSTAPGTLENVIGNFLQIFAASLDSEAILTVNMQGQTPDDTMHVPFVLRVQTPDGLMAAANVDCPVQILNHAISFTNIVNDYVITEPFEIEVAIQSDTSTDNTQVAFWMDDDIVQSDAQRVLAVEPGLLAPGAHHIRAQLRDPNGDVLAGTQTLKLFVQHQIVIGTQNGITEDLSGEVVLQAVHGANLTLPPINWMAFDPQNPGQRYLLEQTLVQPGGRTTQTLPNIYDKVQAFFPLPPRSVMIQAEIPSNIAQEPLLAVSQPLPLGLQAPAPPPVLSLVPVVLIVILIVVNAVLFRLIRRAGAMRLIGMEDDYDLPDDVMAVTVRKGSYQRNYPLTRRTYTIGRARRNDIAMPDDNKISREHGVIMWRRGKWYYTNRKRQIHTSIDGKRHSAVGLYPLKSITHLELGDFQLVFHYSKEQPDEVELAETVL